MTSGLWGQTQEPGRPQDHLSGPFLHLLVSSLFFSAPQSAWWENGSPGVPSLQTEPHAKMDLTLFHPSCGRRKPVWSACVRHPLSLVQSPLTQGTGWGWGSQNRGLLPEKRDPGGLLVGQTPQKGSIRSSCLWAQGLEGLRQCDPRMQSGESFKGNTGEWSSKGRFACRSGLGREGRTLWPAHHSCLVPCT